MNQLGIICWKKKVPGKSFPLYWSSVCIDLHVCWLTYDREKESREKGRDPTQSYDKSPYTHRKIQKATWQHKKRHKCVAIQVILEQFINIDSIPRNACGTSRDIFKWYLMCMIAK